MYPNRVTPSFEGHIIKLKIVRLNCFAMPQIQNGVSLFAEPIKLISPYFEAPVVLKQN